MPKIEGKYQVTTSSLICESDLRNQELVVKGLSRMTDALISIQFFDGGKFEGLVSVNNPKMMIPGESNLYPTNYFWLGVEHLLSGIDHLIFVLGLIFLVVGFKTLIKTITAFTVAHSITLALSVTNTFQLPQSSAEALIALTLIYLAIEVGESKKYQQTPWLLAFGFGLLHGFGFAGALSEIGFSDSSLLYSLLFFNLGIEAGQLLVVPIFGLIVWLFNRVKITNFIYQFSSYLIGGIACFWLIERVAKIVI
jgi:hydrogenase/urease accessory protein HupE